MKNVVLIGFMGTGKSVIGRRLANALGFRFVDTDRLVEKQAGKTIAKIFAEEGEARFREWEADVAKQISGCHACVIATGGGMVTRPENLGRLAGIRVALTARPDVILKRTQAHPGQRPLLRSANPLADIARLLAERAPFYRHADLTVDTSDVSIDAAVRHIQAKVIEIEGQAHSG